MLHNLGVSFPNDSVRFELYKNSVNPSNLIKRVKVLNFGETDSVLINWIPTESGTYNLIAQINGDHHIDEDDYSDNTASAEFSVFDFGQPNIVKPVNGLLYK